MPSVFLAFALSSFELLPTLNFQTFWKHLHILCYQLGVSNHRRLEQIKHSVASKYIIFTDSLSHLQALQYMKLEHPLIGMVIWKCVSLNFANKDITFCRVPSHVGIRANEKADFAAKSALDLPSTDFKHHINQYVLYTWQDVCNGAVANKLYSVKPLLGNSPPTGNAGRMK